MRRRTEWHELHHLTSRRDGAVEHLTLNRPDVRNAFNEEVIAELTAWAAATREAAAQGDVRVVVLSGAGKMFCAGRGRDVDVEDGRLTRKKRTFGTRWRCRGCSLRSNALPVPLVGRVQGAALGGGAGLAAVCDIVVADESGGVRLHRGQARDSAGRDLAVRAREDRPLGGARAVSDRRAFLGGARAGDRARSRGRAGGGAGCGGRTLRPRTADGRSRGNRRREGAHPAGRGGDRIRTRCR